MTRTQVSFHNIEDAEAVVRSIIRKGRKILTGDQMDELVSEGMRIMCKLATDYEPGKNGLDPTTSSFSGYVWKLLPGKLSDAANRLHGGHLATLPDGSRRWHYDEPPASLERIAETRPGGLDTIRSIACDDEWQPSILDGLVAILEDWWQRTEVPGYFTMDLMTGYFEMRGDGYTTTEFAFAYRLLPLQAKAVERFGRELLEALHSEERMAA